MDKQISVFTNDSSLEVEFSSLAGAFMLRLIQLDEHCQNVNHVEVCLNQGELKGFIKALQQILSEDE